MEVKPQLFLSKVMHKRFFPKENAFNYNMYYLALPLSQINNLDIKLNKGGLLSFHEKDHGFKDGRSIEEWVKNILKENSLKINGEIILITLPRVLGYVFNPVSFYFCFDENQQLKAVISEVNNTFGETHIYICVKENNENINHDEWLEAEKIFHVSPFLERAGKYKFRFNYKADKLGIWIDFFDENGNKKLITSLLGEFQEMNSKSLSKAFWGYPLITFKTIILIHWQALKLAFKKVKYIVKPEQLDKKISLSTDLKNR